MQIEQKFAEVREALTKRQNQKNASLNTLAGLTSVSKSQLSDLLRGNLHRKDGKRNFSDALINRLYAEFVSKKAPVMTSVFETIKNVALASQQRGEMYCVVGKAGLGKSTTLQHLAESKEGVYYTLCSHLDSPEDLLAKIWASTGQAEIKSKGKRKRKAIIEGLAVWCAKQETKPLIILDDIHYQGLSVYQDLKLLYDMTEGMMGIMLVGTEILEQKLKRWAGYDEQMTLKYKPKLTMPEFVRRFKGGFFQLNQLTKADITKVCERYNVKDAAVIKHFIGLHYLEMGMLTAKLELAASTGKEIDLDLITML